MSGGKMSILTELAARNFEASPGMIRRKKVIKFFAKTANGDRCDIEPMNGRVMYPDFKTANARVTILRANGVENHNIDSLDRLIELLDRHGFNRQRTHRGLTVKRYNGMIGALSRTVPKVGYGWEETPVNQERRAQYALASPEDKALDLSTRMKHTGIWPEQIRAARGWLGWSGHDLANHSKVSYQTIAKYERNETMPSPGIVLALRKAIEEAGVHPIFSEDGQATGIKVG